MVDKKKSKRDYLFVGNNHKNRHVVKAINLDTDEVKYYYSMYACCEHLGINAGIIKMCAEGKNYVKSGISKIDGQRYRFEYVDSIPEGVELLKCSKKPRGCGKKKNSQK